jgi:mannose-6-phosphate isomerase-like protein (cupin superfamily)
MKETTLPDLPDAISPAGADVRLLMDNDAGGMIHSTVPAGQTNRAVVHATVSEFWYILEGHGEIWRKDHEQERVTTLVPGVSIDIPVGTAFQYRNIGTGPLKFICVTMPRWPGAHESSYAEGIWKPSI